MDVRKKGLIIVNADNLDEDELMMLVLDNGAEDLQRVGDVFQITCSQTDLAIIKKALEAKNIKVENADIAWLSKSNIDLDETAGRKILKTYGCN